MNEKNNITMHLPKKTVTRSPAISFILPVYNVADYIPRCVESITGQITLDYEILLVDDGSTDDSGTICDELANSNEHIHAIHKPNGGLASARNYGLDHASGKYIFFVDSDDYLASDITQSLERLLSGPSYDIIKFDYLQNISSKQHRITSSVPSGVISDEAGKRKLICEALNNEHTFVLSAWSYIYRRKFIENEQLRFVSEREIGSEDFPFTLEAFLVARSILVIHEPLYVYDLRDGSLTSTYRTNIPEKYAKLYQLLKRYYHQHVGDEYDQSLREFYIWSTYGLCSTLEYQLHNKWGRTMKQASQAMKHLFNLPDFRQAILEHDCHGDSIKRKILITIMRHRWEWLLSSFYACKQQLGRLLHQ
jgi:glycosyltransferase involved in cell wall biosynthesis